MGRGDARVSDSESVRREKTKEKREKWENLPWEKKGTKTLSFPWL